MLYITIPETELWDENKQEFVFEKAQTLRMEHSLISISKWESKWCKSFFSKEEKTYEQTIDYIQFMTISPNVDPSIYRRLTKANVDEINEYIMAPMTATKFYGDAGNKRNNETITSELIYYWMISLGIPVEFEKWHINRLLTLIKICNVKNQPPKKMSKSEIMRRNSQLNAARRQRLNSKG